MCVIVCGLCVYGCTCCLVCGCTCGCVYGVECVVVYVLHVWLCMGVECVVVYYTLMCYIHTCGCCMGLSHRGCACVVDCVVDMCVV